MAQKSASLAVVILAAGKGTRMKSGLAKVLHPIAGRPMLSFSIDAAEPLDPDPLIAVVGQDEALVREAFDTRATLVSQREQRGTGHAVLQAQQALQVGRIRRPPDATIVWLRVSRSIRIILAALRSDTRMSPFASNATPYAKVKQQATVATLPA